MSMFGEREIFLRGAGAPLREYSPEIRPADESPRGGEIMIGGFTPPHRLLPFYVLSE
jgi:hypothetical protein